MIAMVKLESPFHGAIVEVPADAVDRYLETGWKRVEEPKPRGRPRK